MDDSASASEPQITSLTARQRRIVGVLVEKGLMTPEYYPLTLKALVAGCNQKSNRDPIVNYSEDDAEETLNELRELGLVAVVHTESGRTERFRHYVRKRFEFTEPQLAVLVELLLRGRQTLGSLRARASRMVPIDSLDQLRTELTGLQTMNLVQSSGALERRGVEVDHNLYTAAERSRGDQLQPVADDDSEEVLRAPPAASAPVGRSPSNQPPAELERAVDELRLESSQLRSELADLREELQQLRDDVDRLRHDLGA